MATKMKTLTINDVTYDITDDSAVSFVEKQSLTEEQKAQARANIGVQKAVTIEPTEDDIPKVFFGGALPQTKDDTIMSFRYISKTADISGYCKTKAQGNSSMEFPKKNQTVKLYKDAECTEKMKVDFKGWGKQSKFCFKANWIDLTHARNIVSARLWGDVVKSRENYEEIPELLRTSPNHGAIDGFPVKVYADGVYQGRYTLNIPKDAWMVDMDDSLDQHCILCGENFVSGCFRAEAKIDESDWTDEVHDTVPDSIKNRWNEAIRFVINSTDEEFVSGIGNYFDVNSLIDYYIFGLVSCGIDAFAKNQIYLTYDGTKWYASMYDMDSTWGLYWNGKYFIETDRPPTAYQDFVGAKGNLLYIRLTNLFANAIKARWEELRDGALSCENIVNRFERFTDICPPWLAEEDYAVTTADGAFTIIPSQTTNNIQQIRNYAIKRRVWCDEYINKFSNPKTTLLYDINDVTLDGISGGINTHLLLKNYDEYTILLDVTLNEYNNNDKDVLLSNYEDIKGTGWYISKKKAYWKLDFASKEKHVLITNDSSDNAALRRHKIAIVKNMNNPDWHMKLYDEAHGGLNVFDFLNNGSYDAYDTSLCIGSNYYRYLGNHNNQAKMTIHSCRVYSEALSDSQIVEFMNG